MDFTVDELMVVCIARQIKDGDVVVQGLATPLVAAGYLLARRTHAPNLYFASAIGQGMCKHPAPLGLARVESLWLDRSLKTIGFSRVATEILPSMNPKEFFRPAQVDPYGNFNNVAFGKDYLTTGRKSPRLRLPGTGGIPDVTTFLDHIYLYVPRHSRVTFIPQLDVRSGLGYDSMRTRGRGPVYLVSDLGEFSFENGKMQLRHYHPGVSIEQIQARTGFPLEISPHVQETPFPSEEELHYLRTEIDPLGIRRLELLSGAARHELIREILKQEL